jgi:hypothetical protein
MTAPPFTQADFVIITALPKEAQAIVNRLENHCEYRDQRKDIRTYHCGTIPITGSDRKYNVAVVLLPNMGEISAANATTDALGFWNPNFVLMVGDGPNVIASREAAKQSQSETEIASHPSVFLSMPAMTPEESKEKAREHLGLAKKMIDEMGYHRRDQAVKDLDGVLQAGSPTTQDAGGLASQ